MVMTGHSIMFICAQPERVDRDDFGRCSSGAQVELLPLVKKSEASATACVPMSSLVRYACVAFCGRIVPMCTRTRRTPPKSIQVYSGITFSLNQFPIQALHLRVLLVINCAVLLSVIAPNLISHPISPTCALLAGRRKRCPFVLSGRPAWEKVLWIWHRLVS